MDWDDRPRDLLTERTLLRITDDEDAAVDGCATDDRAVRTRLGDGERPIGTGGCQRSSDGGVCRLDRWRFGRHTG